MFFFLARQLSNYIIIFNPFKTAKSPIGNYGIQFHFELLD